MSSAEMARNVADTAAADLQRLRGLRDHHARLCADLLSRGALAEAKRHAQEYAAGQTAITDLVARLDPWSTQ